MADISASDDLRRQLDAHVQSLRAAGVEWLPLGPPLLMAAPVERAPLPAASGGKDLSMAQLAQPAAKQALRADLPVLPHPFLAAGQRVRIARGPLTDVEGFFVRAKPAKGLLVISIDMLHRSVAVEVDCTFVEAA